MLKIQYGIAGFFSGVFCGLLLALIEMRIVNGEKYPAIQFFIIALTIIIAGISGMTIALKMADKKLKEK